MAAEVAGGAKLGLFGLVLLLVMAVVSSCCMGNCENPGAAIFAANWSVVEA